MAPTLITLFVAFNTLLICLFKNQRNLYWMCDDCKRYLISRHVFKSIFLPKWSYSKPTLCLWTGK